MSSSPFSSSSCPTYGKDNSALQSAGYIDSTGNLTAAHVPVPYTWLDAHVSGVVHETDAYEAAAKVTGANGHKVWESYVIGADPNDKDDSLKITAFPMKANGTPDFDGMEISPPQSKWNVEGAQSVIKGKATLDGAGEWEKVTEENEADMRFFKVEVVLP